jgi:aminopeptidase-like protein
LSDVLDLTRDLCAFATGVVAPDNERLFARLGEELPLKLSAFPSGSEFNGWLVPDSWRVERALIRKDGQTIFDGAGQPLAVAAYSNSFSGSLELDELKTHLVTNPELPEALVYHCMWQYRPWDADWALSVPHSLAERLEPGSYEVELVTVREPGEMVVATVELPGDDDRTIVFNAHTCHPRMANDDFAGVAVLVRLFQWLQTRERRYTYLLVLGPEHLGTVFYLRDLPRERLDSLVGGVFAEMPGTRGPVTAASTFLGDQPIDDAVAHAGRGAREFRRVGWRRGAGNDETVWEAPGYEVPFVELSRSEDLFAPFREYHTSLDTPDLMDAGQLEEFLTVLQDTVEVLEGNAVPRRRFDGLICLSNPRYDLYPERPDPAVDKHLAPDAERWGTLSDSLPRYLDGSMTLLDISERHELPFRDVAAYLAKFEAKGLVELEPALIDRLPVERVVGEALT